MAHRRTAVRCGRDGCGSLLARASTPARKSVLFLTSGARVEPLALTELRETTRACSRANVTLYPLSALVNGRVVASHMGFDRLALSRACERYSLEPLTCAWLDTARVSRRAWMQFARRGFGLADIAGHCGIRFRHHEALEDARAAGEVLLQAIAETGLGIDQWLARVQQPIDGTGRTGTGSREIRDGNPDGELFGEVVVFTGALSIPRREAAALAAAAGCAVGGSVGRATTVLVVGDQDARRPSGHEKSSKHRKAEELINRT